MDATHLVREWIVATARPLDIVDPSAPLTDLRPLGEITGEATVVGIGTSIRTAHEPSVLMHRILRFLVEEMGFRSVLLEGDETKSAELAGYIRTGRGDPREMLTDARVFWRNEEILGVLRWLRSYNETHPADPVRLVAAGEPQDASWQESLSAIERHLAEGVIEWQERTGDKIVYWGGIAHTGVGSRRLVTQHTSLERQRNAGSYLRERFGAGYRSVGVTFGNGTVPYEVPAPPADYAEHNLLTADLPPYLLDLHAEAPGPVRAWLDAPTKTRLIGPNYDPANDAVYHLSGQALAEWFDAVVHIPTVTPQWTLTG
ncbi:erythromycin esterase family protein [Amycolatopsis aidingensis]|uniref:erythromycin esterase family protein n=1 Tax=Amycolatopsis aidingensis TaxID=2842453 RepID=UPI001C0C70EC|nr:erythromycin esterase family protein [Amycolatopsis aidingensis]